MSERLARLESRWTVVAGRRIYARVATEPIVPLAAYGPPLVLVHGLLISSRYMVPTARRLGAFCRVYVPDMPGFGQSDDPPETLAVPGLTDALVQWMDATGLERVAFLGNSFCCQVIADLAVRYPARVTRAILVGPTVDPHARTVHQQIGRWLLDTTREPPVMAPILLRDLVFGGFGRLLRTFRWALEDRIDQKLPAMGMPTLVVRGTADPIAPQRWCEEAARRLPCGRLIVIPGAAHAVNYNSPRALTRITRAFLSDPYPDVVTANAAPGRSGAPR
jgi:pimeloyl-ACP methyl ester carboxylesterase